MLATIIISALIAAAFVAIVGKGIYNRTHNKSSCGCGCGDCPSKGMCHPE